MDEARSSWNTIYQSADGFECQITLRDEDETSLAKRASKVMAAITKSGGLPVKRKRLETNNAASPKADPGEQISSGKPEKTYVDEDGVRRCNKKAKDGTICGTPVVEKDGRYGPFWSCPNYKEHAA
jgi:hypothetical protein